MDNNYNQTDSIQKRFSTILIEKREEKGLSQTELAQKLYVTRQAVSKWETGKAVPDAYMLLKIADILDCSVSDLIADKQPLSSNTQPTNSTEVEPSLVTDAQPLVSTYPQPSTPQPKKHAKFKRIAPVWAAVLAFTIIASTLMGVYIPKATHAQTQPEPQPITYVDIKVAEQGSLYEPYIYTDGDYRTYRYTNNKVTSDNLKLYWRFTPDFTSDYRFEVYDVMDVADPILLINDVEFSYTRDINKNLHFDVYLLANTEYIIQFDYTKCNYLPVLIPSMEITMTGYYFYDTADLNTVTIPANSDYTLMLPTYFWGNKKYRITNENVLFTNVQCQKKVNYDSRIKYVKDQNNWIISGRSEISLISRNDSSWDSLFKNRYFFVTLSNNNDHAISLDVETSNINTVVLGETYNVKLKNDGEYEIFQIPFGIEPFQIVSILGEQIDYDKINIFYANSPLTDNPKTNYRKMDSLNGDEFYWLPYDSDYYFLRVYENATFTIKPYLI